MDRLSKYLLLSFSSIFLSIFGVLFLITSIIIIISISNVTSNIHITFLDLLKLYLLSLPRVIFITLSISFFISTVALFSKFSETTELIALFSNGISPFKILKPFFYLAIFITILNLIILFISIPYSKTAYHNLKNEKRENTKFNFQTSQMSQRFDKWNIFISSKEENKYKNIILYNNKEQKFILAKEANLANKSSYISLKLNKGKIYDINKSTIIDFSSLEINKKLPNLNISIFKIDKYFSQFKKLFIFYLPFALIPISLIFFIPVISFFHPRVHKNYSLLQAIFLITLYLVITKISNSIAINLLIITTFFFVGLYFYKRKIKL
ncbi:MAG TPA: LptF/LptG family permease [Nautiliaceae bacterium]|nr:LptF/LptG family permease [Nautiliaceae bacterium]